MKSHFLVSTGLLVLPLLALAQPPQSAPASPQISFEKHTLSNGLQLILHVDRKLPVVQVNLGSTWARRTSAWAAAASRTCSST